MALMFSRLAHNFVKNGYFPTDEVTLERILGALDPDDGELRIYDPTCGEGVALAEVKLNLEAKQKEGREAGVQAAAEPPDGAVASRVVALGVEKDGERAWHAKRMLDTAIHADVYDSFISKRSCSLMFLNPPYGDQLTDQMGEGKKKLRLEVDIYHHTFDSLQLGGILVYIIPYYAVDEALADSIARNFSDVTCFMAPETKFKQCVIMGVRRVRSWEVSRTTVEELVALGKGERMDKVFPSDFSRVYAVPAARVIERFTFKALVLDAPQIREQLLANPTGTLWSEFESLFGVRVMKPRRPLLQMRDWHLALALASGLISGVVKGGSGRTLLIKGSTRKTVATRAEALEDSDGKEVGQRFIHTEGFETTIMGVDLTAGPSLGKIVRIR